MLQTDLLPLLIGQTEESEMSDVLLRLLVNLTSPTLLLYREEVPRDGPNRRIFMHLVEILQSYKAAFALEPVWTALETRLKKVLGIVSNARARIRRGVLSARAFVFIVSENSINYALPLPPCAALPPPLGTRKNKFKRTPTPFFSIQEQIK